MVAEGEIMQSRLRVPEHVVYRSFGEETVVVNLRSGKYHGLLHFWDPRQLRPDLP